MFETPEESLGAASGLPTQDAGEPSQRPRTFQLRWVTTLEGARAAEGGALEAGEGGGIDVVLVRDAAVHRLACHLLVPLALSAGHRDAGSQLEGRGRHGEWWQTASQLRGNTLLPGRQLSLRRAPGDRC